MGHHSHTGVRFAVAASPSWLLLTQSNPSNVYVSMTCRQ